MKFLSLLFVLASLIYSASAHSSMSFPPPRGHPLNPNAPFKDYGCITAPLNGGPTCAAKPFPCGGYPVDTKFGTTFNAGEVFEVKFYNPNNPGPTGDQGRHNGGLSEFALSYDGGKTWTKIATYHKTCPDIFYTWKVKIPENAPSCTTLGKCIFSWSWINAVGNREFYQNCADVQIIGKSTTPLPIIDITKANLPEFGNTLTPEGDPANTGNAKGSGPLPEDVEANLKPFSPNNDNKPPASSTTEPQPTTQPNQPIASSTTQPNQPPASPTTQSHPTSKPKSCQPGTRRCISRNEYMNCENGKQVFLKCEGNKKCHQRRNKIECK